MRLVPIFVLSLAAGAAAYYALATRARPPVERAEAPVAAEAVDAPAPAPPSTAARAEPPPPPAAPEPPPLARPRAPLREPTPAELAALEAERLAGRERMSREKLRSMLESAFEGKLADRELAPHDYERLTDAVLRLRAAQRVLRNLDESAASAAAREEHRQALLAALGEMEEITGVPPASLGEVLAADEGLTREETEDPETVVHETLPQDPSD